MHRNVGSGEDANTTELIKSIPTAMRRMGWSVSAQLMERWLRAPAWVLPKSWKQYETAPTEIPSTQVEKQLVRMDWAMTHQREMPAFISATLMISTATNISAPGGKIAF